MTRRVDRDVVRGSLILAGSWMLAFVLILGLATCRLDAQTTTKMAPNAKPGFEVATIRPADALSRSASLGSNGHRVYATNRSVESLLSFAYGIHAKQILNGPAWLRTERFNIDGVSDTDGEPDLKQMQGMFRKLLADRFKLVLHEEKKEFSVYAVIVAKGGPKLTKSANPDGSPDDTENQHGGLTNAKFTNMAMTDFVLAMQFYLDRPVVDQTGLTGRYDFTLDWTADSSLAPASETNAPPGLFTAIQEQLGLKLESVKAPAEVLVIEHVERPSDN